MFFGSIECNAKAHVNSNRNIKTGECLKTIQIREIFPLEVIPHQICPVYQLAKLTPNLMISCTNKKIRIWNTKTGNHFKTFKQHIDKYGCFIDLI